jgi:hypothetical protein
VDLNKLNAMSDAHDTLYRLRLASFNITATFFSDPKSPDDPRSQMQHKWEERRKYFKGIIEQVDADVWALQELSPEQALDLLKMFPDYEFFFFFQAQTPALQSGSIYRTYNEILDLVGKDIGTAIISIMYNPKFVIPKKSGIFWYNPEPFKRPTATDRGQTNKGFGNMNTPRAPGYVQFNHIRSGKPFWFFVSHAPISGGTNTRIKCFELERKIIKEIANEDAFFSVGDRNIFSEDSNEAYKVLVSDGVYDWFNNKDHVGPHNTWLGYLYEPKKFQNQILTDGSFEHKDRPDIGYSSIPSIWSAHYYCIIRKDGASLLGKLTPDDNLTRNFLSDHAMLVAEFEI